MASACVVPLVGDNWREAMHDRPRWESSPPSPRAVRADQIANLGEVEPLLVQCIDRLLPDLRREASRTGPLPQHQPGRTRGPEVQPLVSFISAHRSRLSGYWA